MIEKIDRKKIDTSDCLKFFSLKNLFLFLISILSVQSNSLYLFDDLEFSVQVKGIDEILLFALDSLVDLVDALVNGALGTLDGWRGSGSLDGRFLLATLQVLLRSVRLLFFHVCDRDEALLFAFCHFESGKLELIDSKVELKA